MKKKQILKLFLVVFVLSFLSIFLTGCIVLIPGSPIVEINITNDSWTYDIYVDGNYLGRTDNSGKITLSNITTGYHHFEAFESPSLLGRYGDKWQTITDGYNRVNIVTN